MENIFFYKIYTDLKTRQTITTTTDKLRSSYFKKVFEENIIGTDTRNIISPLRGYSTSKCLSILFYKSNMLPW